MDQNYLYLIVHIMVNGRKIVVLLKLLVSSAKCQVDVIMVLTEMVGLPVAQAQIYVGKVKETVTVMLTALVVLDVDKAVDLMTIVINLLVSQQPMTAAMTRANVNNLSVKGF